MVKSELVARLAHRHPELTIDDCHSAVDQLLHSISLQLVAGGRIEIRAFGSFGIVTRSARIGRNPKSGEPVAVPEKRAVHFKPGKLMRDAADHDIPLKHV